MIEKWNPVSMIEAYPALARNFSNTWANSVKFLSENAMAIVGSIDLLAILDSARG